MRLIARRDSWTTEAFGEVEPIPYRASLCAEEFERVKAGLIPEQMEDKWFIYYEEPSLFLHRSWTGNPRYRIDWEPHEGGARVRQACRAVGKSPMSDSEYEAKLLGFLVSNLLLGRREPFPVPREEPNPDVYQHVVAGTGYPSVPVDCKRNRPWWKFWRR